MKNVALVGAGRWGKNLARNFHALGALHTICDPSEAVLDLCQAHLPGVKWTASYQSAIEDPAITRIAIAAPASLHYLLAKQAILAGKDTFVEKPLCLNIAEGEELIALAKQKGAILMVGHLLQYHPGILRLQELVKSGEIGKLQCILSNRLNLGAFRSEENVLWSFAPHDISVILSLCGFPSEVRCTGGAYLSQGIADTTLTTLRFSDERRAQISSSWIHPYKEQKLVVVGSSGMAVFDDLKPWHEKLMLHRNYVKWIDHFPQAQKSEPEFLQIVQGEPLQAECEHFLQCCAQRIPPKTDGMEGLRVLKVLQAAQASLEENGEAKDLIRGAAKAGFFAHPSAVIDSGAEIAPGTKIWHFSHIMDGAKIDSSCNLGQNVVVSPGVILGRNVKVQNNVSLYTGVICEEDVFLGPSVVFTNVKNPRSAVNRRGAYQKTLLKRGATVGANATIVCGIELGEFCFVGAGAVVTKDVKPFALVVGNPAHQIGWMSRHGERLELPLSTLKGEILEASCPATEELYRLEGDSVTLAVHETATRR